MDEHLVRTAGGVITRAPASIFLFFYFSQGLLSTGRNLLATGGRKWETDEPKDLKKLVLKKENKKCSALFNALRFSSGGIQLLDYRSHVVITRKRMLECNGRIAKNKIKSSRSKGHRPVLGQLTIIRRNEASRETDRTRSAKIKRKKNPQHLWSLRKPPPYPLFPKSKEKSGQENIKPNTYWH